MEEKGGGREKKEPGEGGKATGAALIWAKINWAENKSG